MRTKKRSLAIILLVVGLVFTLTFVKLPDVKSQQDELSQLEQELNSAGFGWLIDYEVDYPRIEIYEVNGSEVIASFDNLVYNRYNKVYLTNLVGEQDVFDLLILNGSIEFDHIIDPSTLGPSAVNLNAPTDGATGVSRNAVLDVTPVDPDSTTLNVSFFNRMIFVAAGGLHTCGILAD